MVSLARGFHFLDFRSGEVELIVDPEPDKPANRLNDGKVDRQGRFYAGSMDTQEAGPNGALYRLDPDLSLHRLDTGIVVSNGPCWSPDGRTFYFADTWSGEIWAYDCDPASGAISNRRTFTRVDMSGGARPTAPRWTPRAICGTPRSTTASWCAMRPTAAWTASSRCRSRKSPA